MKRRRLEMYGMFASFGHQKQRVLSRAIRWVSNCVCRFDPVKGLLAETQMGLSPQPARGAAIF